MRKQILALSGGGVRGLYTINFLADLEESLADKHSDSDYSIARHFDLIAGTSVGGILALGLAYGRTARELRDFMEKYREPIFAPPLNSGVGRVDRWAAKLKQSLSSIHSSAPLADALKDTFGNDVMRDLKVPVVIPSVNGTTGLPKFFKTPHHSNFTRDASLTLVDVALSTSAAPTYFDPHLLKRGSLMVDGGLVANGPSLIAYHEATQFLSWPANETHILSVGTMGTQTSLASKSGWGYLRGWGMGERIIELTLGANEAMQNYMVQHLLGDRFVAVDDPNTRDTAGMITLNNAAEAAAQVLRSKGVERAQYASAQANVMAFFDCMAANPTFYRHGEPREIQRT